MNIFFLSLKPRECAQFHCDKHVVKMIVEYCQLLSTAHHVLSGDRAPKGIYKSTHKSHPSALWVMEGLVNYEWLHELLVALCKEYTHRYHRVHKCESSGLVELLRKAPVSIPNRQTPMRLAMPEEHKDPASAIRSYREYYSTGKAHLLVWTNRRRPRWLEDYGFVEEDM